MLVNHGSVAVRQQRLQCTIRPSKVILKHLNYGNIAWGKHNIRLYNLQKNHS